MALFLFHVKFNAGFAGGLLAQVSVREIFWHGQMACGNGVSRDARSPEG